MTLYIPPPFRVEDAVELAAFVERNAFGTVVCAGPAGLEVSHVPFLLEHSESGLSLLFHLARANPQGKSLAGASEVLAIFEGPHAYVSPGWYEHHPAVPTWNYAVVHARGPVEAMDEAQLRSLLGRLSEVYESGRPKPWRMSDLPEDYTQGMLRALAGFTMRVERLEGKFKLSQNRPGCDAERVADALSAEGQTALAELMRAHPPAAKGKIPS